jgi:amino acid transporter
MSEMSTGKVAGGVFARKSSGLVRTVSTFDTFYYCLVQLAVSFVILNIAFWVFYPGANMEIAGIFALVAAILEGVTYGLFTSVYPRSGGEYVPLSRATHPFIGFVASFTNTFWQIYLTGVVVEQGCFWGVSPLFSMLGLQTGNQTLINLGAWFNTPPGWFAFGLGASLLFAYNLYLGMKSYFKVQKWLFSIALICFLIFMLVLVLGSTGVFNFQANFDKYFGAGAYTQVVETARADGADLNPPMSWKYTIWFAIWPAWSFFFAVLSTAFSGEIKNVKRGQLIAIPLAQAIGGVLVILTGIFARYAISKEGLLAVGYVGVVAPDKFPLAYPWITLLASIMADNPLLTIIINFAVIVMTTYVAASTLIYGTRGLFAWALDGMAPQWLGKVSEKHRSPVNAIIAAEVVVIITMAIYSFTSFTRFLQGMAGMGVVFCVFTFSGAIFPFIKREVYETSPARIEVFGIPLMTITGLLGTAGMGYITYRVIVDSDFGANSPISMAMFILVFVAGAIWYFVAREVRRRQGIDMDKRFEEIPVE